VTPRSSNPIRQDILVGLLLFVVAGAFWLRSFLETPPLSPTSKWVLRATGTVLGAMPGTIFLILGWRRWNTQKHIRRVIRESRRTD